MIAVLGAAVPAAGVGRPVAAETVGASVAAATAPPTPADQAEEGPSGATDGPSGTGAGGGLTLVSQTSWVKPGQMFNLTVSVGSRVARSQLGIALSVYAPPDGQSSFEQTLSGNTSSESLVSDTQTVPLQSLPTNSSGDSVLQAAISAGNYSAPPASFDLDLQCAPEDCNGVYPLRVQLMDTATGSVVSDLVTYILFIESNISSKLRVALVVPLGSEPAGAGDTGAGDTGAGDTGVPAPPRGSTLSGLETTITELESSSAAGHGLPPTRDGSSSGGRPGRCEVGRGGHRHTVRRGGCPGAAVHLRLGGPGDTRGRGAVGPDRDPAATRRPGHGDCSRPDLWEHDARRGRARPRDAPRARVTPEPSRSWFLRQT